MVFDLRSFPWLLISTGCLLGCPGDDQGGTGTEGASSSSTAGSSGTTVVELDTTAGSTGSSTTGSSTNGSSTNGTTGTGSTSGTAGDTTTDGTTTGGVTADCTDPATAMYPGPLGELDVIFVVDNSGTMGPAQVNLVQAMDSFVARLDDEGLDYRIAVTTTDVGNPWCNATTPEAGNFVATSCRARQADFVFNGSVVVDVTNEACLNVCPHDSIALLPTTTDLDPTPAPRPWIERIDGTTNLPAEVTPAEALRCMVPQGINGCGFERPLEAMRRALLRTLSDTQTQYGFLRAGADLLVVLVSEEVDCSYDNASDTIFLPNGNRVFWSDPMAPSPTSAVCWNAGVECSGGPGMYDECHAQHYDVDGNVTNAANAVMVDVGLYIDQLMGIDAGNGPARVRVAVLGGVPLDYPDGGDLVYADSPDPMVQNDFGIGPGCEGAGVTALPPVRMREMAEAFADPGERNLYSLCDDTLCDSFEAIIDDVVE